MRSIVYRPKLASTSFQATEPPIVSLPGELSLLTGANYYNHPTWKVRHCCHYVPLLPQADPDFGVECTAENCFLEAYKISTNKNELIFPISTHITGIVKENISQF